MSLTEEETNEKDFVSRTGLPVQLSAFQDCWSHAERDLLLYEKRQERQAIPEKGYQAQTPGLVSAAAEDLRVPDLCFRDALQESLDLDYRLALKLEKADWCFPMGHRYVLRHEFPLGMTAEKFYAAVQELVVDEVLNGTPVRNGELIEIDDGLAPYFFYVYNQATVLPAKVFGLKKEDHDET